MEYGKMDELSTGRESESIEIQKARPMQDADECLGQVHRALAEAGYMPLRRIVCTWERGILVLRGQVPSYYMKSMAQQTVLSLGVKTLVNQIEVTTPHK